MITNTVMGAPDYKYSLIIYHQTPQRYVRCHLRTETLGVLGRSRLNNVMLLNLSLLLLLLLLTISL